MTVDLVSALLATSRAPDKPAIRSGEVSVSYRELDLRTRKIAAALQQRNCKPGDRVAIILPKSLETFVLFLGILRAGCVAVPIATEHPDDSVARILNASDPALVIVEQTREMAGAIEYAQESFGPNNAGSLGGRIRGTDQENWVPVDLGPDADALLLFTSGTTGNPKGVLHTVSGLLAATGALIEIWELSSSDTVIHGLPISHAHGLIIATLPLLKSGGSILWLDNFEPRAALGLMPHATCFMGVPFHYQSLLDCPDVSAADFAPLRLCACGSAPLNDDLALRFKQLTGKEIAQRYGMTETIILTANPPARIRSGTVGRALPGVSVRVTDPETSQTLGPGTVGEVVALGPSLLSRYINYDADSDFTPEGFFRTGDMGYLDDSGYLTLVGRRKDIIIYSGQNVYPKDVELHLRRLVGVQDACVFGVPHPQTGEAVIAAVVALPGVKLSPADIRQKLIAKLALYQVPKRVLIIDAIPRNTLGKPLRNRLVEMFKDMTSQR